MLTSIMPIDGYFFNIFVLSQAKSEGELRLRQVAAGWRDQPFLHRTVDNDLHPSTVSKGIFSLRLELDPEPMVAQALVIPQEARGRAAAGEDKVRSPSPSISAKALARPTIAAAKSGPREAAGTRMNSLSASPAFQNNCGGCL